MTSAAKHILESALGLPDTERQALAEALSESLGRFDLAPEWRATVLERLEKIDSGEAQILDARQHLESLRIER